MTPRTSHIAIRSFLILIASGYLPLSAQWIGSGAGGSGTNFNDPSNWASGNINGSFTGNASSTTIQLTNASSSLTNLDFNWATSGINLAINGNGVGGNEVLQINGDIILPKTAVKSTVTLGSDITLDLGTFSSTRQFIYGQAGSGSGELVIDSLLTGTATGSGRVVIAYNGTTGGANVRLNNTGNNFDAPLTVSGNLYFASIGNVNGGPSALGAPTTVAKGLITMSGGATLYYTGSTNQTTDRAITQDRNTTIGHVGTGGALTFNGEMNLGVNTGILYFNSDVLTSSIVVNGKLSNGTNKGLEKQGRGTLYLNNQANEYTGATLLNRGTLVVTKLENGGQASSIGASSNAATNLVIGAWNQVNTLRYEGAGDSTDRLFSTISVAGGTIESSGTGAVKFTNTGAVGYGTQTGPLTWTLGGTNANDNTIAASFGNAASGGVVSLVKKDAGLWRLTGTNSYTGSTAVTAGTLIIDGTISSSSGVSISSGATLGGHGIVSAISGAGLVTPGNSAGILTASTLSFSSGLDIALEMTQAVATWSNAAASGNDVLRLRAAAPILDAAGGGNSINLYFSTYGSFTGGIFTDTNLDFKSLVLNASYTYYILAAGGSYTYNGQTYSLLSASNVSWTTVQVAQANFASGDVANGWSQQFTVVPEPSSMFLLIAGVGTVFLLKRFRRVR